MADDKAHATDVNKIVEAEIVSDATMQKVEELIEAEEGAANRLIGWASLICTGIAVSMSLFHLYAAYAIVPTQELRYIHVAFTLILAFLLFPVAKRFRDRLRWWDIVPGIIAIATIVYALWGGEDFTDRATLPDRMDVIVGVVFILLLLEATRRTTGWIMPVVSIFFIAYAMLGPHLPAPWTHRGYDLPRLVGHLFITLEGIFGVAVDVSATLIILFTIYGADKRARYRNRVLPADVACAFTYAIVGALIAAGLAMRGQPWWVAGLCGGGWLLGGLCDVAENLAVARLLDKYPKVEAGDVAFASRMTQLKLVLFLAGIAGAIAAAYLAFKPLAA